ncbi:MULTISPECIES: hypothetical protein [Actinokineospora]|uniref:Uncharacterized protein n=1 Tax=Actinokineospora diospyrosa TaxID=103728 RepID=A0ABT1IGE4_9PSEU|nr:MULTISPECIES: hypothetical protein [Actinokineospora]MBM7771705.1 hypothetical protein [Actinokineospora baliensis]MCP2271720.1 hypothetical protein [Actinokineospora diospyrosa]
MASTLRRVRDSLSGPVRLPLGLLAAAVCVGVAVLQATVLTVRTEGLSDPHAFLVHWAHPAVWIVLGAVCLEYAMRAERIVLNRTAMVAVGLYLAFLLSVSFA